MYIPLLLITYSRIYAESRRRGTEAINLRGAKKCSSIAQHENVFHAQTDRHTRTYTRSHTMLNAHTHTREKKKKKKMEKMLCDNNNNKIMNEQKKNE